MSNIKKDIVESALKRQLNEALESINASHSFDVIKVDLAKMKFTVEFDIYIVPEDDYIGIAGY